MRDRLIELLKSPHKAEQLRQKGVTIGKYEDDCVEAMVADFLLANGVIVPPVVLGSRQKVYIPISGTTVVYDTKIYGIGVDEDGDMVINPKEYPEDAISVNAYNLGKTVFLTREEAERDLKGGEGDG